MRSAVIEIAPEMLSLAIAPLLAAGLKIERSVGSSVHNPQIYLIVSGDALPEECKEAKKKPFDVVKVLLRQVWDGGDQKYVYLDKIEMTGRTIIDLLPFALAA